MSDLTDAKRRIVDRLKRAERVTANELATEFGLTDTAVRQHLEALEAAGLITRSTGAATGRGRPPIWWSLTPASVGLFPDRHGELTVGLIRTIRATLGDDAMDQVIAARTAEQIEAYRQALPTASAPLTERLAALADLRSAEGYMAEVVVDSGDFTLIEHHCPICDAAAACQRLCAGELETFQTVLGPEVTVERTQHLLASDARCAYRVTLRQTS